ncbi:hypothetical protein E4U43_005233 [Claviceps pusilla]|uniref:Apolipoprotein/apolipophorin n=1 Tax=Claviceps pusilla TaxID=123648 RepID=A0A9P7NGZ8_9HYPO|nr:hypothetical protein E4U43_005233 [Claviceps pusilla]
MYPSRQFGSRLIASRSALRPVTRRIPRQQCRHQSTSTLNKGGLSTSHMAVGVIGGVVGTAVAYGVYSFTPAGRAASKLNKAAIEASKTYDAAVKKIQNSKPDADQAVNLIKQFAYSYAAWVPGGKGYVDAIFKDWEAIRNSHQDEADKIVNDAYKQLKEVSKSGLSMETASKAYDILADVSKKIASLGSDAISDIIDNHPAAKEKFGPGIEKLQSMAKNYGPDVKKQVDQTWGQVKDILAGGFSASNLDKARKLIEEKVQEFSNLGDEAWNKGLEAAKPYLDKNPKIKELIEKNADSLKQSNLTELFQKVRSGNAEDLQKYVQETVEKGKKMASDASDNLGFDKYLKMVPQGGDVLQKLQQLSQVADKHKEEGEKLFNETVEEIRKILEKQSEKGKDIIEKAKKEAK